ncbi:MAG TPA: hypothetical protein PLZ51_05360, partial [Aggregatilineales bacterium]|nr:hypothetical protein [Aggregatilineales bacterium]
FAEIGMKIRAFEANPFDTVTLPIEELRDIVPLDVWKDVLETQKRLDIGMAAASNTSGGNLASAGLGFGLGQQLAGQMNPSGQSSEISALQQQLLQQQQMMNQMMMNQMGQNQQQNQPAPTPTSATNPQTKEEIVALIDALDAKLINGEISEATHQKLTEKWQTRLDGMG